MNSSLSAIAVLASLLFICSNSGSASWLNNDCGSEYQGAVGPWTALLQENGQLFCAGTLITKCKYATGVSLNNKPKKNYFNQLILNLSIHSLLTHP